MIQTNLFSSKVAIYLWVWLFYASIVIIDTWAIWNTRMEFKCSRKIDSKKFLIFESSKARLLWDFLNHNVLEFTLSHKQKTVKLYVFHNKLDFLIFSSSSSSSTPKQQPDVCLHHFISRLTLYIFDLMYEKTSSDMWVAAGLLKRTAAVLAREKCSSMWVYLSLLRNERKQREETLNK